MAKKWKMKPEAVRLLRRVKKHILEEPRRLDMSDWVETSKVSPCGTTACIAGWTLLLKLPPKERRAVLVEPDAYVKRDMLTAGERAMFLEHAENALELDRCQSMRLFYDDNWPKGFDRAFDKACSRKARAQVTADRIEHFIKTGE